MLSLRPRGIRYVTQIAFLQVTLLVVTACGIIPGSARAGSASPPIVPFTAPYPTGSIVIVNTERKLYYVLGKGRAIQYPVAVGRPGELWVGRTFVAEKRVSPTWSPMNGGRPIGGGRPENPLGKRALYLDWSLIRIHGTPSRGSIGRAVSNGCIRMFNEDVIDLYSRVHLGAPVIAVNTRREADQFAAPTVSGKQPAHAIRFR
jgi:lipoprotein-anchoring transpeptidase ErfK/SrfK